MSYLETTKDVYKAAAETPDVGLCCTTTPVWQLPGLDIPTIMLEMNYGCGSTVNPRDLVNNPNILYVGVGGGMELVVAKSESSSALLDVSVTSSSSDFGVGLYVDGVLDAGVSGGYVNEGGVMELAPAFSVVRVTNTDGECCKVVQF